MSLKGLKEHVRIFGFSLKKLPDFLGSLGKVDQQIAFVFLFRKFLSDKTLTDTPCAFNQKGALSLVTVFPFQKLIIYFSLDFHNDFLRTQFNYSIVLDIITRNGKNENMEKSRNGIQNSMFIPKS